MTEDLKRRMRVNISKNTKGYNFDYTFEVESDNPEVDLAGEMDLGLRQADRSARLAILEAEYTDIHGMPGSDDREGELF